MKRDFAGFLPAAIVSEKRDRAHVTALTGLVMCDFDHVPLDRLDEVRQKVNQDPHTVLSYITLSGEGLRVLAGYSFQPTPFEIKAAEDHYRKVFIAVNAYYSALIGLEHDPACKDMSRLSFAAYDPTAFYRPESQASPFSGPELNILTIEEKKKVKKEKKEKNKMEHRISETYRLNIKPMLAKDGEVYGPGTHNRYVMRVGYLLNKYGFPLLDAQQWAMKEFPDYDKTESVIASCYRKTDEHGEWAAKVAHTPTAAADDERKKLRLASHEEVAQFVHEKMEVRFNLIRGLAEMRWKKPPYQGIASLHSKDRQAFTHDIDGMVKTLVWQIEKEMGVRASKEMVYDIIESDCMQEFDPLTYYLTHLPAWDPEKDPDYLDELAHTVELVDDANPEAFALWQKWLKKWMVWMLVGWLRPEEVNQTILTFIGAQGTYKSTWFKSLMPPELREYFKIKQNGGEVRTDDLISMSQYGLILHEEMDVQTARESNTMKAMITAQHSDERAPYGRTPRRRYNIATLCATGNSDHFLNNEQGTRRFIVFRVKVVKSPIEFPFNYAGIYSQSFYLLNHGFQYYFSPEEQAELEQHNHQFEVEDTLEQAVEMWIRQPQNSDLGSMCWMRPSQIADWLSGRSKAHTRYDANKLGRLLTRMGFTRRKHQGKWGYYVKLMEFDEAERRLKQIPLIPESQEDQPKEAEHEEEGMVVDTPLEDMPESVQTLYSRLLGEKDEEEEEEDSTND
jgi:predicted P-loop ATPase